VNESIQVFVGVVMAAKNKYYDMRRVDNYVRLESRNRRADERRGFRRVREDFSFTDLVVTGTV
jgi:hypothetical protein